MRNVLFASVLYLLSACQSDNVVPEGILPDSTMKSVLVELSIVDAAYNVSMTNMNAPKFKSELFYEQVMKQHGTTRAQFIRSMDFYAQHTKRLQKIYEDALVDLANRQAKANQ